MTKTVWQVAAEQSRFELERLRTNLEQLEHMHALALETIEEQRKRINDLEKNDSGA